MKKILLAVLSIAALASCMQDENLSVAKGDAIVFENAFVDNATKAIDPSITNVGGANAISEFQVWGTTKGDHAVDAAIVPIFADEKVDKTTGDWRYDSGKTQYWIAGNEYNFAAIVNADYTVTTDALTGTETKTSVVTLGENKLPETITYTANGTTDLLYARSAENIKGKTSGNEEVGFTFRHLLSKAVFTFTNTSLDTTNNLYKVEDIKITGLNKVGVYTVGSGWAFSGTETIDYKFGNIVVVAEDSAEGAAAAVVGATPYKSNFERLLIPGTHTVAISCTIKLYLNGDATTEDNLAHVTPFLKENYLLKVEEGKAYNFALSAGLKDAIEFKVTAVDDWANGNTHDSKDDDKVNDHTPLK